MLGRKLASRGHTVFQAQGDADLSIVCKAIEAGNHCTTIVVGEDTDLLVLLCYYVNL